MVLTALVRQMTSLSTGIEAIMQSQRSLITDRQPAPQDPAGIPAAPIDHPSKPPEVHVLRSPTIAILPGGAKISEKMSKSAIDGDFINLVDFLSSPDYKSRGDVEPILDDDGKLSFRTKYNTRGIENVAQWLLALNNYEYLIVSTHPSKYAEMLRYRDFIMKCAQKFQWYAVYSYDCRFRAHVAKTSGSSLATTDT